jgi:hypothetical protein
MAEPYEPVPSHLRGGRVIQPTVLDTLHDNTSFGVKVRVTNNTANWYDAVTRCTFYRGDGAELDWQEVVFRQMPPYTSRTTWFWSGRHTQFTGRTVCEVSEDETMILVPPATAEAEED